MRPPATRPFPLVPRRRFAGVRFGQHRSPRRGQGDEVGGSRAYRAGDRRTWIDWRASAKVSAARGADEFVVREFFADTAPRVVVVFDRRPRMGLYGAPFPWLDKPAAMDAALRSIGAATTAARGDLAYIEDRAGHPLWLSPRPPAAALARLHAETATAPFGADARSLDSCLGALTRRAASLPAGTFVFVLSDFVDAVAPRMWFRMRALRWDVTPVVVQDPVWEQSFPELRGVLLPIADVATGERGTIWVGGREARARRAANEQRLEALLGGLRQLGTDPILLGSSEPAEIAACFEQWAVRRRRLRRRSA